MHKSFSLLLACLGVVWGTAAHGAPKCPADPLSASYQIWPGNTISAGKLQAANHPCGRRLECTGGNTAGGGAMKRSCRWAG